MKGTGFNDLIGSLRQTLAELPDCRTGKNLSYKMEAFGLSAFSNRQDPLRQSDPRDARSGGAKGSLSGV